MGSDVHCNVDASVNPTNMPPADRRPGWIAGAGTSISGAAGAVAGLIPHVLHHVAPIVGAAVITGAGGSVVFGALGFLLMVPMLLRIRRRFDSWAAPAIALAIFVTMFGVSTLLIGPAIRGAAGSETAAPVSPALHETHHPQ